MAKGQDNLIPFNERTEEEQREIARQGGIASGEARREKATMRKTLESGFDASKGSQTANAIDKSNGVHSGRTHGNIGVTTSQQMLEAELKISKWNIYEEITNLFLNEFVIYTY